MTAVTSRTGVLVLCAALLPSSVCLSQAAVKTEVKVTNAQDVPTSFAKVYVYSLDDKLLAEGLTDKRGIYTCPEIDTKLHSVQLIATYGGDLRGKAKLEVTSHGVWPSRCTIVLEHRRIKPASHL